MLEADRSRCGQRLAASSAPTYSAFCTAAQAVIVLDRDPPLPRPLVPCNRPLPAAVIAGTCPEEVAACGDPSDQKSTWIDSKPEAAIGKELMGFHAAAIMRRQSEARCSRKESMRW